MPFEPLALAAPFAGAAWGSFAATLAHRSQGQGRAWQPSRSRCLGCGRVLGFADLLPVLGYALRRGRCASCGMAIPAFYPLAELGGFMVGLTAAIAFQGNGLPIALLFGGILLAIAVRDIIDFTIPDWLSLPLLLLGLAFAAGRDMAMLIDHALAALFGGLLLWLVAWGYRRTRGREGLGFGDVKLFAALGAWLGLEGLAPCLLLAALGALAFTGVQALMTGRKPEPTTMIPLGTWLGIAGWVVYVGPQLSGKL